MAAGKLYIAGDVNDRIYQYSLPDSDSLAGGSYDNKSFDVGLLGTPWGVAVSPDGVKMVLMGTSVIRSYTMSTPFDVSTATYDSVQRNLTTDFGTNASPAGLQFDDDGDQLFVGLNFNLRRYALSTPYDISTATASGSKGLSGTPAGFCWSRDGTKFYQADSGADNYLRYDASTPFDMSTLGAVVQTYATPTTVFGGVWIDSDGSTLIGFSAQSGADDLDEYSLSTAYQISSGVSYVRTLAQSQDATPRSFTIAVAGGGGFVGFGIPMGIA